MGSGTELAKAYVQIIPSAKGISGSISSAISGEAGSAGASAGSILGNNLGAVLIKTISALGLGQLLKESLLAGADLQKSLGGVETLFKDHADTVIANAKNAYATAGMSANEYMETVTSFSASLLQSLGGDTEKAAQVADMALVDMADNANKMGTSMEMIQNAYQGFAKQNYTMLDNLKLGYGGTKTEMERLLADASKLSGVEYDISNLNDVYEAIHVIQEDIGITGATADEAAGTFTGSMNAMKAAAENFMGNLALGKDVAPALMALIKTSGTFLSKNLVPMIRNVFNNVVSIIGEQGTQMIASGSNAFANFINGISEKIPELIPKALEMLVTLSDALIVNLPVIVDAGVNLLKSIVQGIINGLPTLITDGPRIINAFSEAIFSALGTLLVTGFQMISSLGKGLWDNRGLILDNAGEIFLAFLNVFSLSKLFSLGGSLITNLKNGIKNFASSPVNTLKEIATNSIDAIKNLKWKTVGKNIIEGIAIGFSDAGNIIIEAVKDVAGDAIDGIKKLLGIKSPSRVFRDEVGKMMGLGLAVGVEESTSTVTDAMKNLTESTMGVAQTDLSYSANVTGSVVSDTNTAIVKRLENMEKSFNEMVEIMNSGFDMNWDDRNMGRLVRTYA